MSPYGNDDDEEDVRLDEAVSSAPSSSPSPETDRERAQAIMESLIAEDEQSSLATKKEGTSDNNNDDESKENATSTTLETGKLSRETFYRRGFIRDLETLPSRQEMKLSSRNLFGDVFDDTEWSSSDDDVEQGDSVPPPPPLAVMDRMQTLTLTPPTRKKTFAGHININNNNKNDDDEQPSQIQRLLWKDEITTQRTYVMIAVMIAVAFSMIGGIIYFLIDYI